MGMEPHDFNLDGLTQQFLCTFHHRGTGVWRGHNHLAYSYLSSIIQVKNYCNNYFLTLYSLFPSVIFYFSTMFPSLCGHFFFFSFSAFVLSSAGNCTLNFIWVPPLVLLSVTVLREELIAPLNQGNNMALISSQSEYHICLFMIICSNMSK